MKLPGDTVTLIPMTKNDKNLFFEWATKSENSSFWYGDLYGDEIPDYESFFKEWHSHYFQDEYPEKGRCFFILKGVEPIGQINYNEIDQRERKVELDIIIPNNENTGKGYGTDAIKTLTKYLFKELLKKKLNSRLYNRDNMLNLQ